MPVNRKRRARMLAIARFWGVDRKTAYYTKKTAAWIGQTLRDWAHSMYNGFEGVRACSNRRPPDGICLLLSAAQKEELGGNGSGKSRPRIFHRVVRGRRIDLKAGDRRALRRHFA